MPLRATYPPSPDALHAVEILATSGLLIGLEHRPMGSIVEVTADQARRMHGTGCGRVLEPGKIADLPEPSAPLVAPPVEPFPEDPRVTVRVLKSPMYYAGRSHAEGDKVIMTERTALQVIAAGLAALAKGQDLSRRGIAFQRLLKSKPGAGTGQY